MRPASRLTDRARLPTRSAMSLSADAIVSLKPSTFGTDAAAGSVLARRESRRSTSSSTRSRSAARARCASCHGIDGYPARTICLLVSERAGPQGLAFRSVYCVQPGIDVLLGFVLGKAVALLQPARELGPFAFDDIEVVVGQLAPFLAHLTLESLPVTFDAVPIHSPLP